MKILFVGFGITPYFRDFLNRIQSQGGITVTNVRPVGANRHIGAGVHQDFSGIGFTDLELPEKTILARRLLGMSDFEAAPACNSFAELGDKIRELLPAVIVVNVNFHAAFSFDPKVKAAVRHAGSKIVLHSIPFQQLTMDEALDFLKIPDTLPMKSLPAPVRWLVKGLRLDRAYLKSFRRKSMIRRVEFQRLVFNAADAHAVYFEGGIDVYGSYGVPPERVRVVRNSPNTEKLIQAANIHPRCDTGSRLIHIGRLVEWKRVDMLIRVVARLRTEGFPAADLVVIGYGPCEQALRDLAKELGVTDAVHFRGGVYEPDDLAKEFASSSIYVMAGMGGLSINEAMCFGVPIVCSRGDGTERFLVREGLNGMYFEEGNESSLFERVHLLLSHPKQREQLGRESRRIIDKELNTKIHVSNYLKLFLDLTGNTASK